MTEFSVDYDECQVLVTDKKFKKKKEKRVANFSMKIIAEVEAPEDYPELKGYIIEVSQKTGKEIING